VPVQASLPEGGCADLEPRPASPHGGDADSVTFRVGAGHRVLEHAKADVTQVDAERDLAMARDIMTEIG
jgi:hypothetical protein